MPQMSGLELQQELQQRGVTLPVVMLSAHGDVATTRAALKKGAVDFLEKPVNDEILADVLHECDSARRRAAPRQRTAHAGGRIAREIHTTRTRGARTARRGPAAPRHRHAARHQSAHGRGLQGAHDGKAYSAARSLTSCDSRRSDRLRVAADAARKKIFPARAQARPDRHAEPRRHRTGLPYICEQRPEIRSACASRPDLTYGHARQCGRSNARPSS